MLSFRAAGAKVTTAYDLVLSVRDRQVCGLTESPFVWNADHDEGKLSVGIRVICKGLHI